jgi:hypothetical protein
MVTLNPEIHCSRDDAPKIAAIKRPAQIENQKHWTQIKSETADQSGFKNEIFFGFGFNPPLSVFSAFSASH